LLDVVVLVVADEAGLAADPVFVFVLPLVTAQVGGDDEVDAEVAGVISSSDGRASS
jgi:hypothetical protein